jgi:hypothetical protein
MGFFARKVMNKTCCRYSFWDTALHTLHGITDNLTDLRSLLGLDQDLSPENSTKNVEIAADKPDDTEANQSIEGDLPNTQPSYAMDASLHTNPILTPIGFEGILYGDTVNITQMGVSMLDTPDLLLGVNENVLSTHNYIMSLLDGRVLSYRFGTPNPFSKLYTRNLETDILRTKIDSIDSS